MISFVFTRDQGQDHLVCIPQDPTTIYLNRETFAKDFLFSQMQYLAKVEMDQTLWDNAINRLHHAKGFLSVFSENDLLISRLMDGSASNPSNSQNPPPYVTGVVDPNFPGFNNP